MSIDEILLETEEKMLKTEEHVLHEFGGVRTGKASPSLVENIHVEAYGSNMRLRELATISVPEPLFAKVLANIFELQCDHRASLRLISFSM